MPDLPDIFISVKKRSLGSTDLLKKKKKKKAEQWSSWAPGLSLTRSRSNTDDDNKNKYSVGSYCVPETKLWSLNILLFTPNITV